MARYVREGVFGLEPRTVLELGLSARSLEQIGEIAVEEVLEVLEDGAADQEREAGGRRGSGSSRRWSELPRASYCVCHSRPKRMLVPFGSSSLSCAAGGAGAGSPRFLARRLHGRRFFADLGRLKLSARLLARGLRGRSGGGRRAGRCVHSWELTLPAPWLQGAAPGAGAGAGAGAGWATAVNVTVRAARITWETWEIRLRNIDGLSLDARDDRARSGAAKAASVPTHVETCRVLRARPRSGDVAARAAIHQQRLCLEQRKAAFSRRSSVRRFRR